jgi:cell wall-associated NlpC family hydrolase
MTAFDARITLARPDLAASHLRGQVEAEQYSDGQTFRVLKSVTPLFAEPRSDGAIQTECLYGETVTVLEQSSEGWSWSQSILDSYVGYVSSDHLGPLRTSPTHRVTALRSFVYPTASIKHVPQEILSFGAHLSVTGQQDRFSRLEDGGFVITDHLTALEEKADDPARFADLFLHSPYLWGGRSSLGLDCSALVQLSFQACSLSCPRDSDMQEKSLGEILPPNSPLQRNDLVFWKGHVGLMLDDTTLLHASGHHMRVVKEPLAQARRRILEATGQDITACKRPNLT